MTVTDEYLANNAKYAETFTGPLPLPPSRHVAVVACMDSRMDVFAILGLGNGEQGYRPHVTLSRKAGEAPGELPAPDFLLRADRFCLYQSVSTLDGVHYEPLACWPLRARAKATSSEELTS